MSDILLRGLDIAKLLTSAGPVVKGVLLRATDDAEEQKPAAVSPPDERVILKDLIDEINVDTTPKKSMVAQILGGPFTFLGQYEEEGIVLMCAKSQQGPLNTHQLQPPLTGSGVRGDVLILKVAPTEGALDDDDDGDHEKAVVVPTNDEFFLDYTKEEYIAFASRTDVVAPEMEEGDDDNDEVEEEIEEEEDAGTSGEEDEETSGEEDEDDSESQVAMMNLIMGQVLRRFHEENGRGPDTQELLELRSALAEKIGVEVPEVQGVDWDQKASSKKKAEVADTEVDSQSPCKPSSTKKRAIENGEPCVEEEEQEAKRVKFLGHEETESAEGPLKAKHNIPM